MAIGVAVKLANLDVKPNQAAMRKRNEDVVSFHTLSAFYPAESMVLTRLL